MDATAPQHAPSRPLDIVREDGVVEIWLTREAARNALSLDLSTQLVLLFDSIRHDASVRLVLIRARGPVFSAGLDLKEMRFDDRAWMTERRHRGLDTYLAVERCEVPVIAVVHAPAVGGGCELACSADYIVASDAATFQWPEARLGSVGATQRLSRLVGSAQAKRLLFTGRALDAVEAERLGLVAERVAVDELEAAIDALKRRILDTDPVALRGIKRVVRAGEGLHREAAIELERNQIEWALATHAARAAQETR